MGLNIPPQKGSLFSPCLWGFQDVTFYFLLKFHLNFFFFTFKSVPHCLSLLSTSKFSLKTNHIIVFLISSREKFDLRWKFFESFSRIKSVYLTWNQFTSVKFPPQTFPNPISYSWCYIQTLLPHPLPHLRGLPASLPVICCCQDNLP